MWGDIGRYREIARLGVEEGAEVLHLLEVLEAHEHEALVLLLRALERLPPALDRADAHLLRGLEGAADGGEARADGGEERLQPA